MLIEVDGDSARSEHHVLAMTRIRVDGVLTDFLVSSRIVDLLECRDGRWAIAWRRLRFDWSHELGPRPDRWLGGRLDPAELLFSAKFPDDPVYQPMSAAAGAEPRVGELLQAKETG